MTRYSRAHLLRLAFVASLAAGGCARMRAEPSLVPQPDVDMDARLLEKFYEEVQEYLRLRKEAGKMVPPLASGADAGEIATHQKAISDVIMQLRKGAKQGDIFKREVAGAFRRIVQREISGPDGAAILGEIHSGNPKVEGVPKPSNPTQEVKKTFPLRVNGFYADEAPFSSVPPSLLLKMPQLPEQARYRFVGRALILRDTEANVILDFIPDIVPDPSIPR